MWQNIRFLAYGVLLGTAGFKILGSKDAKKVYSHITAAALRGADDVIKCANDIKEGCEDVVADAKEINEKRAVEAKAAIIKDAEETLAEAAKEAEEAAKEAAEVIEEAPKPKKAAKAK